MWTYIKILYQKRELLWLWTMREIRVRYKQSLLGGAWAILQPLSLMLAFSVIFTYLVKIPVGDYPYPVFSYTGLLPWTFLASSISMGVPTLVQNINLVTKVYFPREILPIATVLASFLDFLVASLIYFALILYYQVPLKVTFLMFPVLLAIQILLTLGIVLFFSAIEVFYRDIRFLVPLAIQLWMYATPIIYPTTLVPENFRFIYMLNPMAVLIESYRSIFLYGTFPDPVYLSLAALISILLFVLGYQYFKRVEWQFADLI